MSKENDKALMGCLLILLAIPYAIFANGYVLAVLWRWFIIPTFPAAPHLHVLQAIGLACAAKSFTDNTQIKKQSGDTDWMFFVSVALMRPWIAIVAAWPIHWMMS